MCSQGYSLVNLSNFAWTCSQGLWTCQILPETVHNILVNFSNFECVCQSLPEHVHKAVTLSNFECVHKVIALWTCAILPETVHDSLVNFSHFECVHKAIAMLNLSNLNSIK